MPIDLFSELEDSHEPAGKVTVGKVSGPKDPVQEVELLKQSLNHHAHQSVSYTHLTLPTILRV